MNQITRIIKNTGVEVISNMLNMGLSAVFTFIVARMLGPQRYGVYSLVTTFPLIFAALIIFGLDCVLIRDIARDKKESGKMLFNAILFQSLMTIVTSLVIIVSMFFLGYEPNTMFLIIYFFLFCTINSITTVNSSVFKAFEKMEYNALLNSGERFLVLLLGITVIMKFGSVFSILSVFVIIAIFKLVISLRLSFSRFVNLEIAFDRKIFNYFFKEGYPIAVSSFFTAFRWNIVIVIISKMLTETDTGYYNAALKLAYPILVVIFAYSAAILPVMSKYYKDDDYNLERLYKASLKLAMTFSIPLAIMISFFSSKIVNILFGNQYLVSATVLKIVVWILPFSFLLYPLGNLLIAMNRQKIAMKANGYNSIILVILAIILTHRFGLYGASASIVLAEFLLVITYFYNITKIYKYVEISEFLLKPFFAGFLMFLAVYLAGEKNLFFSMPVSLMLYFFVLYFSGIFHKEEIEKIKEAFRMKNTEKIINE
ncbi:MAG: flippase [Candidatus Schekmanbacteria bacterium]|nr:MAG: flippase [Candidatus Schekmanbacteria bacterium]